MGGTAVVVGVSVISIVVIVTVFTLLWRSRVGRRPHETPEARYQREMADLRPRPQTWRAKRVERRSSSRKVWAAGSAGAVGMYYGSGGGSCGGGSCGGGSNCGGGGG